jgi:drug/metabolite transporter (DMT)-like permease
MKNLVTYLSLIAAATFWGANFVVGKLAIGVMAPMSVIAWRFMIAGALMLFLLWAREPRTATTVRQNLRMYGVLGLLGIFGMNTSV